MLILSRGASVLRPGTLSSHHGCIEVRVNRCRVCYCTHTRAVSLTGCQASCFYGNSFKLLIMEVDSAPGAAMRRRQWRSRQFLRLTVAMALAEKLHHTSRGQMIDRARREEKEMNFAIGHCDPRAGYRNVQDILPTPSSSRGSQWAAYGGAVGGSADCRVSVLLFAARRAERSHSSTWRSWCPWPWRSSRFPPQNRVLLRLLSSRWVTFHFQCVGFRLWRSSRFSPRTRFIAAHFWADRWHSCSRWRSSRFFSWSWYGSFFCSSREILSQGFFSHFWPKGARALELIHAGGFWAAHGFRRVGADQWRRHEQDLLLEQAYSSVFLAPSWGHQGRLVGAQEGQGHSCQYVWPSPVDGRRGEGLGIPSPHPGCHLWPSVLPVHVSGGAPDSVHDQSAGHSSCAQWWVRTVHCWFCWLRYSSCCVPIDCWKACGPEKSFLSPRWLTAVSCRGLGGAGRVLCTGTGLGVTPAIRVEKGWRGR